MATAGDPLLEASDLELHRQGPSYTYDTLAALRAADPHSELYLVMGMDAFADIASWHRSAEILEMANMIVTSRPGYPDDEGALDRVAALGDACYDPSIGCYVHSSGNVLVIHDVATPDISASDIRRSAAAGPGGLDGLVTAEVARFIETKSLYQPRPN